MYQKDEWDRPREVAHPRSPRGEVHVPSLKRALVAAALVAVTVIGLTACVPIPPGEPSAARCWTGQHTVVTHLGTLKFRSTACWENAVITSVGRDGSACTNLDGSSAGIPDVSVEARGVGGFTPSYTATMRARCRFSGGIVFENHRHTVTRSTDVHKYCYTPFCDDSAETLSANGGGGTTPTTSPPAPAARRVQGTRVTVDGSSLPATTVTVDGAAVPNGANGSFNHTLPADFPNQHTVRVIVPAGYTVAYTGCANNTTCHSGKTPVPGDTVTANPDPGQYLDVRWYFARSGTIQGFKVIDHVWETYDWPEVRALKVYLDEVQVAQGANPYVLSNLTAGSHLVRVEDPSGWYVGYTLCYNSVGCHNDPVHEWTDRVYIDVPAGGFADLYWHYYPCPATDPGC